MTTQTPVSVDLQPAARTGRIWRVGAATLLLFAAALFVGRAVVKAPQGWDFAHVYAAAQTLAAGQDPYDRVTSNARWAALAPPPPLPADIRWLPLLMPPSTVMIVTPLAALPPVWAWRTFLAISLVLVVTMIVLTQRLAGTRPASGSGMLLTAWVLAFAPLHSGINAGQPAMWCVAGVVAAVFVTERSPARSRGRDLLAGALVGVATAIKPQLAGPFLIFFALRGHWRAAAWGAAIAIGLFLVAAGWMQWHVGGVWSANWLDTLRDVSAPGGPTDYGPENPTRTHMLNLQLLLNAFIGSRPVVNALGFAIASLAGVAWCVLVWRDARGPRRIPPLLAAAALSAITLLPLYHRYYDATILLFATAWIVSEWPSSSSPRPENGDHRRWPPVLCALAMVAFFLPVAWVDNASKRGLVPTWVEASPLWETLIIPHQVWALTVVTLVLLAAMRRPRGDRGGTNAPGRLAPFRHS